jgi:glycine/D-amino acid oxidase-like deaminating enzyme
MIAVIGAGIAGSSVTRVLRERGAPVTLISSGAPHSLAATAVLRRAWHHGTELARFDESLDAYRRWRIPVPAGAQVTSYRRDGTRPDPDWAFIHPAGPLLEPDITAEASEFLPGRVLLADGREIPADTVIRATGATGRHAIGGKVTWGGTWRSPGDGAVIRIHHYAPYKMIAAAGLGGGWRFGSSSAADHPKAYAAARNQFTLAAARAMVPDTGQWELVMGARVKTDADLYGRDPGGWWIGGFHRTGYALAPAVARELADQMC